MNPRHFGSPGCPRADNDTGSPRYFFDRAMLREIAMMALAMLAVVLIAWAAGIANDRAAAPATQAGAGR